ncbi:hypothetical protein R3P38DRAFT_3262317 [Favolaschia claudopus]|uniref:Uncharacterized protein n=1 Tax=Favolaschia claudopus TaxID=2862362 RepID=A0AAW0CNJ7_9AGAR
MVLANEDCPTPDGHHFTLPVETLTAITARRRLLQNSNCLGPLPGDSSAPASASSTPPFPLSSSTPRESFVNQPSGPAAKPPVSSSDSSTDGTNASESPPNPLQSTTKSLTRSGISLMLPSSTTFTQPTTLSTSQPTISRAWRNIDARRASTDAPYFELTRQYLRLTRSRQVVPLNLGPSLPNFGYYRLLLALMREQELS